MWKDECSLLICLFILSSLFEFVISLMSFISTENKVFWFYRIINSLLILSFFVFIFVTSGQRYQDGAHPILAILPCTVIIFFISELLSLIIYIADDLPQTERYIYTLHLIILVLYFLLSKICT